MFKLIAIVILFGFYLKCSKEAYYHGDHDDGVCDNDTLSTDLISKMKECFKEAIEMEKQIHDEVGSDIFLFCR